MPRMSMEEKDSFANGFRKQYCPVDLVCINTSIACFILLNMAVIKASKDQYLYLQQLCLDETRAQCRADLRILQSIY